MTTAAVIIIGDEVLAGRTRDANTAFLGGRLAELGIALVEGRVVRDRQDAIIEAVNALRPAVDYVFTSGGIGPTHDDITCDAVALAFGLSVAEHPEALARLQDYYGPDGLNDARRRMARIPAGAALVDNPVSVAPGFRIDNVFV
ncbi:MAG: competence/damage-inducible protein A, partial [Gammaproteobacteria bacterium]|nr:competence/damage-inducible protein A [Gammaproteobacteria bacterium]